MSLGTSGMEQQVKEFCAHIGRDRLLVQGAGGNVSWKDGSILWVKASGTWLGEAESKNIFVPVDLFSLQYAIAKRDFSVLPVMVSGSDLRPSIETLLHAIMPQKVVVHLHVVEILPFLVVKNARDQLSKILGNFLDWVFVDYYKPGADLARAVSQAITGNQRSEVVFLKNHGIVIGGSSAIDIELKLKFIIQRFSSSKFEIEPDRPHTKKNVEVFLKNGYIPCLENKINLVALEGKIIENLPLIWALYPDHLVFLGDKPQILKNTFSFESFDHVIKKNPPFIFVEGEGAYQAISLEEAKLAQMCCYGEVISRVFDIDAISALSPEDVNAVLGWDAERYRQSMSSERTS